MAAIWERLKAMRERAGLSQRQLCQATGLQPMTYSRWERGQGLPSVVQWEALMEFYGRRDERAEGFVASLTPRQRAALDSIMELVEARGGGGGTR